MLDRTEFIESRISDIQEEMESAFTIEEQRELCLAFGEIYDRMIVDKQDASIKIDKHIKEAEEHISEAQKIADATGMMFHFNTGDGMRNTYFGKGWRDWDYSYGCSEDRSLEYGSWENSNC